MHHLPAEPIGDDELRALARRSHDVIAEHQAPSGAYPASPTFSAYRGYAWYRDGAFTAEGMSRYGDVASVDAFHDWASRVLVARADVVRSLVARAAAGEEIGNDEMLPTRYTLDGEVGSDPWWDFQTDGYGTWLWAVVTHARRHGRDLARWADGITVATDYLVAFWNRPCYDWWEEHVAHRHGSTFGAIYGGLSAVAGAGVLDPVRSETAAATAERVRQVALAECVAGGHLVKWVGSDVVDASLASCVVPFGLVPVGTATADATIATIRRDLATPGVHRFAADVFFGGGQWPLLTCLLGWNELAAGDRDSALERLRWVAAHATPDGLLPEQVDDHLLHPEHRAEWLERWGTVATPLLWSHGMYLVLADELGLLPPEESRWS
ncbi:MAG: glycoside hydrolase family 15 [Actinomycetales bacterium]|jgi:GH15 family glucan-1,4-alpha-glucosidase|nr:glycoside hydrolase family 15 [Actinomycetales bacterium]